MPRNQANTRSAGYRGTGQILDSYDQQRRSDVSAPQTADRENSSNAGILGDGPR